MTKPSRASKIPWINSRSATCGQSSTALSSVLTCVCWQRHYKLVYLSKEFTVLLIESMANSLAQSLCLLVRAVVSVVCAFCSFHFVYMCILQLSFGMYEHLQLSFRMYEHLQLFFVSYVWVSAAFSWAVRIRQSRLTSTCDQFQWVFVSAMSPKCSAKIYIFQFVGSSFHQRGLEHRCVRSQCCAGWRLLLSVHKHQFMLLLIAQNEIMSLAGMNGLIIGRPMQPGDPSLFQ